MLDIEDAYRLVGVRVEGVILRGFRVEERHGPEVGVVWCRALEKGRKFRGAARWQVKASVALDISRRRFILSQLVVVKVECWVLFEFQDIVDIRPRLDSFGSATLFPRREQTEQTQRSSRKLASKRPNSIFMKTVLFRMERAKEIYKYQHEPRRSPPVRRWTILKMSLYSLSQSIQPQNP